MISMSNKVSQNRIKVGRKKWYEENTEPVPLCKGVEIDSAVYEISENRYLTLITKGIIVYLITAGGIGAYLTAIDIDFNQVIFNIVILVTAIICAALYHSWKSENLGYLVFFIFYAAVMFMFKDYINSGFYAVINDTIDWASIYFKTDGLQYYNERISNRYVAITISMSIIGVAMNVLLNNYILRRARYMVAIFLGVTINVIAFYMQREPATIYSIMLLGGIVMTYVLKCGRHFLLSRRDHVLERSRQGLNYALDYKSLWQGLVIVFMFVLITVATMSTVYDKMYYDIEQEDSEEKEITRDTFQNFIMLGIFGLLDFYPNTGGLSTGKLGGVSSIRLDYMTDLTLIYAPFSYKTLYIKNFTGDTYLTYENQWLSAGDEDSKKIYKNSYDDEVKAYKEAFEEGKEHTAMGHMTVTNVEAPLLPYQPYYSVGDARPLFTRQSSTYEFYPLLEGSNVVVDDYEIDQDYLRVPEQNEEVIENFIKEAGIGGNTVEEKVESLRNYYQNNIPYTVRPGATPWRQDFVNYFLTENRKGYCAHFASAGTLILRELGVPARYCEGYAISFNQVVDHGELLEDSSYEDYYQGFNETGEKTAPVRVNATDADAHAWIEVYEKGKGWRVVEVTPTGGLLEEEDDRSFWESFNNIFGDGEDTSAEREPNNVNQFNISGVDSFMKKAAVVIIVLFIFSILGYIMYRFYPEIKYHIDYSKAGPSDKLILKYSRFIRKRRKKDKSLRTKMNYAEQMEHLISASESDRTRMTDILERAGFSRNGITQEELTYADGILESLIQKNKNG